MFGSFNNSPFLCGMENGQKYIKMLEKVIQFRMKSIEFAKTQEQIDYAKNEIAGCQAAIEYFKGLEKK